MTQQLKENKHDFVVTLKKCLILRYTGDMKPTRNQPFLVKLLNFYFIASVFNK